MKYYVLMYLKGSADYIGRYGCDKEDAIKKMNDYYKKYNININSDDIMEFENEEQYMNYRKVLNRLKPKPASLNDLFKETYGDVLRQMVPDGVKLFAKTGFKK